MLRVTTLARTGIMADTIALIPTLTPTDIAASLSADTTQPIPKLSAHATTSIPPITASTEDAASLV